MFAFHNLSTCRFVILYNFCIWLRPFSIIIIRKNIIKTLANIVKSGEQLRTWQNFQTVWTFFPPSSSSSLICSYFIFIYCMPPLYRHLYSLCLVDAILVLWPEIAEYSIRNDLWKSSKYFSLVNCES